MSEEAQDDLEREILALVEAGRAAHRLGIQTSVESRMDPERLGVTIVLRVPGSTYEVVEVGTDEFQVTRPKLEPIYKVFVPNERAEDLKRLAPRLFKRIRGRTL